MVKQRQNFNLQEPQRNRNATAFFVNLIRTSNVTLPTPTYHAIANKKNQDKHETKVGEGVPPWYGQSSDKALHWFHIHTLQFRKKTIY